ncbi:MAG: polysaccharide biosynthesis C-terminal domain-containing protein, partial [Desulfatiglandales bacterium]
VKIAAVALVANLVLSLLLMGSLKHGGLALALSLASGLQLSLLLFFFKRRVDAWNLRPILVSAGKCILASIVMGVGIHYIYSKWWVPNPTMGVWHLAAELAVLVFIGVFIYFVVARILGCRELTSILDIFKRTFTGNKPH